MEAPKETLLEFPCQFPIKVFGRNVDGLAETLAAVVRTHDPRFEAGRLSVRNSGKGNYLALTFEIEATSLAQLNALYQALSGHPMVAMVL